MDKISEFYVCRSKDHMKTNINMNEKLITIIAVIAYIIIMFILSVAIVEADDKKPEVNRFIGEISASYSPVINREHNIYAELDSEMEIPVKFIQKNLYVPFEMKIVFADHVKPCSRTDNTYITTYNTGFAYIGLFKFGIGYKFNEDWKVELLHETHRLSDGYTGDRNLIKLTYVLGK